MAISAELAEKTLERLRERYRPNEPEARLVLFLDSRDVPGTPGRTSVALIDRSSAWWPLLPPEQIVEIFDKPSHDERRPHE